MEMEDFYLLDEQADGSMDGIMQVNEAFGGEIGHPAFPALPYF